MHKLFIIIIYWLMIVSPSQAQLFSRQNNFTHQDTLRGSITGERAWWDVTRYDISVEPDYATKTIRGENIITCMAVNDGNIMQIDMQLPMQITAIFYNKQLLKPVREGNVYHVDLGLPVKKGTIINLDICFKGKPREASNPPWDGGWIWKKDHTGAPWMSVACQGLGASAWYPCKDYQGDEPDSASLSIIVPDTLVAVGNGRLRNTIRNKDHTTTYVWAVVNPINNYNIVPYIGKYVHWSEIYEGENGPLDCNYWVLRENEAKGKKQFTQVASMLKCFEHWFGPYPFYEDGYKLVESPHLGMEHQSAIAYGNKFENGYLGKDLSGTGRGLKWDFIIVHESGHEWFANNITTSEVADMWVHEGFTSYSETLFTECAFGKEAGDEYCLGTRRAISNDEPVIGHYGVNKEGSVDMYFKGANMIHTIRQIINDDEKFRNILRGLNKQFYHQTVTTKQVEDYISDKSGSDLSAVFDQYLRTIQIPSLEYGYSKGVLSYRWTNCVKGFNMPLKIIAGKEIWIKPTEQWQTLTIPDAGFKIDPNFYVNSSKM
jgi:aminopeptidase N